MELKNRYDGVSPRVIRNIRYQAARLARSGRLPGMDQADIEQELMLDLLQRQVHFDPARASFETFADRIINHRVASLIARGILVPPRTYTMDLGVNDELAGINSMAGDFDMRQADKVLNRSVLNDAVVQHWREKAGDRRSIFFCSTVDHADAVAAAFRSAGITAETISGDMVGADRADLIARFDRGEVQVLTNCMVLTEGFDSQPVGCIGILRPMLHKGTFIQAIGRGLRKVDPQRYPGIIKTDCVILDFAGAAIRHGCLEQEISLDDDGGEPGEAPYKTCPDCQAEIPLGAGECPFCGHIFAREVGEKRLLTDFDLLEIDLLNQSPFQWCDTPANPARKGWTWSSTRSMPSASPARPMSPASGPKAGSACANAMTTEGSRAARSIGRG